MMVYDFKYPALARTLFYQFCKNRKAGKLPPNCGFRTVNFTDVEYSNRINPIQRKYIPDLAAASETAATLLASLNKGGGDKKGGSEAFFTNSAENFLAAIIYFFVNFHPVGFKDGKKLRRFILYDGKKLEIVIRNWDDFNAVDEKGNVVLDFVDEKGNDVSTDEDRMFVELEGFRYKDRTGKLIAIDRCWYEDEKGNVVEPDTVTGEYSDMPHVLSFLGRPYDQVFNILMQDDRIASLMAPFKSAYENKANDQLEGMVGTLRVNAARLVSPEAYWVFTGDDFDLKISDREHPSYLVIANDPEKEQVIGSLNALVLNRLVTRVNSKGNIPVSIIVDELPTLYFHKIDRLIGTARSNKVAVTLGFQELPQLEADYGKVGMQKIITTCGNIFMGAARNKETLEWAQNDVFGKANLQRGFTSFIDAMKERHPDKRLVMNAVSGYGTYSIALTDNVDFLYNEMWDGESQFSDLYDVIRDNDLYGRHRLNTVFAAYMNYGKEQGEFNTPGVLLTDAVMFALGGSHLELGDHMLCREYFPNNSLVMSQKLRNAIVRYYDFMTAYQNLLRGGGTVTEADITSGGDVEVAAWPPALGRVTSFARQVGERKVDTSAQLHRRRQPELARHAGHHARAAPHRGPAPAPESRHQGKQSMGCYARQAGRSTTGTTFHTERR